jgi:hypothetical protein
MKELIVDTKIHERLGMRILTAEEVARYDLRPENFHRNVKWPEERSFNPSMVTLEKAMEAMSKCKNH